MPIVSSPPPFTTWTQAVNSQSHGITHIAALWECCFVRITGHSRIRVLEFSTGLLLLSACQRQPSRASGPINQLGDSAIRTLAKMHCIEGNLGVLPVTECFGNHADTIVSVTSGALGHDVRMVTRIWTPIGEPVESGVRRIINRYSQSYGVGVAICPAVNAPGMRWQRAGFFVMVFADPRRNQVVEKFEVGVPSDSSTCPGLPD